MRATALLEQPATRHDNSRLGGHQVVGVFDPPIPLGFTEFIFLADAIELQYPVFETRFDIKLPGADLVRPRVPGDRRLCSGATGRRADRNELFQYRCGMRIIINLAVYRSPRALHELREHDSGRALGRWTTHRTKF